MSAQPVSATEVIYNGPARYVHPYFKKEMTTDGINEFRVRNADGSESAVYTCKHPGCSYERSAFASVRGHRAKHARDLKAERARDDKTPQEVGREVERIIMRAVKVQVKRIRKERDDWKKRAQAAEKTLATLKPLADALGALGK